MNLNATASLPVDQRTPRGNPVSTGAGSFLRRNGRALPRLAGVGGTVAVFVILLVPVLGFLLVAISPRLFGQGDAWFTLSSFQAALSGANLHALADTAITGVLAAVLATAFGTALALLFNRTRVPAAPVWRLGIWALLLAPSYLEALGWTRLVEPDGVLTGLFGTDLTWLRQTVLGPAGVVWVLGSRGVPFAFLGLSGVVRGLGRDFEDAARVHGAGSWSRLRVALGLLAPGLWASLAIVFAEAISDYGVASTLAAGAHFPIATFTLATAVTTFPADYPTAAALGWLLMVLVALAMFAQRLATRGRSYAVLSGRTRPARMTALRGWRAAAAVGGLVVFFLLALGVPLLGTVFASLLGNFGSLNAHNLTFDAYRQVFERPELLAPVLLSLRLALITATLALVGGVLIARLLSRRGAAARGGAAAVIDLLLLGAVGLPAIVLGAGYIFSYNLPLMSTLGIHLYGTVTLLVIGLLAGALPQTSRLLTGSFAAAGFAPGRRQGARRRPGESVAYHGPPTAGRWAAVGVAADLRRPPARAATGVDALSTRAGTSFGRGDDPDQRV